MLRSTVTTVPFLNSHRPSKYRTATVVHVATTLSKSETSSRVRYRPKMSEQNQSARHFKVASIKTVDVRGVRIRTEVWIADIPAQHAPTQSPAPPVEHSEQPAATGNQDDPVNAQSLPQPPQSSPQGTAQEETPLPADEDEIEPVNPTERDEPPPREPSRSPSPPRKSRRIS